MICFAAVLPADAGRAEAACVSLDYTSDAGGYAEAVARLNGRQAQAGSASRRSRARSAAGTLYCVLCRTDGRSLPDPPEAAEYRLAGPEDRYTLYFPSQEAAAQAIACFRESEGVRYAELDSTVSAAGVNRDFNSWGANRMHFSEYLDYIDRWGDGAATVAIVDSGVYPHALLSGRMPESGYDYIDADEDATNDGYGHGTHVAGIVADCTRGAPVYIYPIRVLDDAGGGRTSNMINAIAEARSRGVDVINISMTSFMLSDALDDAIASALADGITVVAAAGNNNCDTQYISPAHITARGFIVVGAAALEGGQAIRASYSNYGDSVDVYVYGTDIRSCAIDGGYDEQTGTSMAAPHISALCALMRLVRPGLSPEEVEARVVAATEAGTAVAVPDLERIIPRLRGFALRRLTLYPSECLPLPESALPASACEAIRYESADPGIVSVQGGVLCANGTGTTRVTARCVGLEDMSFEVVVREETKGTLVLPASLKALGEGAFWGDESLRRIVLPQGLEAIGSGALDACEGLERVSIPDSVMEIEENTFSDAVIVCGTDSAALRFAEENGLQYILNQQE